MPVSLHGLRWRMNPNALPGWRDRLKKKIEGELDEIHINGTMEHRLPGNLNMSFLYVEGRIASDGHQ